MELSKKTFLQLGFSFYYDCFHRHILCSDVAIFVCGIYVKESNLQSVIEVQEQYLDKGNYDEIKVRNSFNTVTVEIPVEGNEVYLTGKYFRVKANVLDQGSPCYLCFVPDGFYGY